MINATHGLNEFKWKGKIPPIVRILIFGGYLSFEYWDWDLNINYFTCL